MSTSCQIAVNRREKRCWVSSLYEIVPEILFESPVNGPCLTTEEGQERCRKFVERRGHGRRAFLRVMDLEQLRRLRQQDHGDRVWYSTMTEDEKEKLRDLVSDVFWQDLLDANFTQREMSHLTGIIKDSTMAEDEKEKLIDSFSTVFSKDGHHVKLTQREMLNLSNVIKAAESMNDSVDDAFRTHRHCSYSMEWDNQDCTQGWSNTDIEEQEYFKDVKLSFVVTDATIEACKQEGIPDNVPFLTYEWNETEMEGIVFATYDITHVLRKMCCVATEYIGENQTWMQHGWGHSFYKIKCTNPWWNKRICGLEHCKRIDSEGRMALHRRWEINMLDLDEQDFPNARRQELKALMTMRKKYWDGDLSLTWILDNKHKFETFFPFSFESTPDEEEYAKTLGVTVENDEDDE